MCVALFPAYTSARHESKAWVKMDECKRVLTWWPQDEEGPPVSRCSAATANPQARWGHREYSMPRTVAPCRVDLCYIAGALMLHLYPPKDPPESALAGLPHRVALIRSSCRELFLLMQISDLGCLCVAYKSQRGGGPFVASLASQHFMLVGFTEFSFSPTSRFRYQINLSLFLN